MSAVDLNAITLYIRTHLHRNPTPAEVAAHFGMSRFALSRQFRAEAGQSLRDYIAALKIEQGIAPLVAQESVIAAQLEAGHQSAATFTHRFRRETGTTPSDYRDNAQAYRQALDAELNRSRSGLNGPNGRSGRVWLHRSFDATACPQPHPLHVRVTGADERYVVFAGLLTEPVPRGVPVLGAGLFGTREFTVEHMPNGTYWLLGCEMAPSLNPLDYFRLDHCRRERFAEPITFPLPAPRSVELALRPFLPSDPPITINMPMLLFDAVRRAAGRG